MASPKQEQIYITWHYTTHGIAYLKHVLAAFYNGYVDLNNESSQALDQNKLNTIFEEESKSAFLFDHIYYLTAPQKTFDKLSTRRFEYRKNMLTDAEVIKSGMHAIWEEIIKLKLQKNGSHLFAELEHVKQHYADQYSLFLSQVWRDMQHYPIDDQIKWFLEYSNAAKFYKEKFSEVNLNIENLRNEKEITEKLLIWIRKVTKQHPNAQFTINVSLGSNETQVAWFILGDADLLPKKTRFIKTLDDKSTKTNNRFTLFFITPVSVKLISNITQQSIKIYDKSATGKRRLAALKWDSYIQQGFSILLLGERGTGKSRIVEEKANDQLISVDCAAFEDDAKAEAELFGYEKGAFTGADKAKKGLFYEAKNKILFLDEIHNLSKRVQAKLMKALQTDTNNEFSIRKLGATKTERIQCTIIFASNKTVEELKTLLLPDFFDRIAQLIITFPALRETPEERLQDWKEVWQQLKFEGTAPEEKALLNWLEQQPLYGNFRDLQKIAIYYKSFLSFSEELKTLIGINSAFEYTKTEFEKYHIAVQNIPTENCFQIGKTADQMKQCFQQKLIAWAESTYHGSTKKQIAEKLGVTAKTLNNWKSPVSS
jgi:transcriptional regulator with AAA-type ATPase domain